jgi:hypothetical protein
LKNFKKKKVKKMKVNGVKAKYYGGCIVEDRDKNDKPMGTFHSYLTFVQLNVEKNKFEQVLTTYEGDVSDRGNFDGTPLGGGLVAGQDYDLTLDFNLANEKDKDGKTKATRHILLDYALISPVEKQSKKE